MRFGDFSIGFLAGNWKEIKGLGLQIRRNKRMKDSKKENAKRGNRRRWLRAEDSYI